VNRPYSEVKKHGLIVDYCGITKELQIALSLFDEQDIKGVLEPFGKEIEELKIRHADAMSFFSDFENKNDNEEIILKFESVDVRDNFEYAFKMFSKSLEAVMPRKEADPYIADFKFLSQKRQMLRNYYGGFAASLKEEGKKVQQLIDEHIRSLAISKLMDVREITDKTFLSDVSKLKNEKARTALVKNKARQIIAEKSYQNPAYYEKMKERLENLIREEKEERKEDADYFNKYKDILEELYGQDKEREKLGFTNIFEFAIFEEMLRLFAKTKDANKVKDNKELCQVLTTKDIKPEVQLVDWKNKKSSVKQLSHYRRCITI
jgi:type I restriction enzyme, R subunit